MHRSITVSLLLAVGLSILHTPTIRAQVEGAPGAGVGTEIGQYFPDFTLPLLRENDRRSLSSFRGQKVILIQFASW